MPTSHISSIGRQQSNPVDLSDRLAELRAAVMDRAEQHPISGNAAFLPDGRVVCHPRPAGDSRYPYGGSGFTFWATANGRLSANSGPYFWLLPSDEGQDPPVSAFVGHLDGDDTVGVFSVLPTPAASLETESLLKRYTVFGHDAVYYFAESRGLLAVLRAFVDQDTTGRPTLYFTLYAENRRDTAAGVMTSLCLKPFCRHQFSPTAEDRWFQRVQVDQTTSPAQGVAGAGSANWNRALPSFVVETNEDVSRFESVTNRSIVRRCVKLSPEPSASIISPGDGQPHRRIDKAHSLHDQTTTSFREYVGGPNRGLGNAAFLSGGEFSGTSPLTTFKENAVVADIKRLTLPGRSSVRCDYAWTDCDEWSQTVGDSLSSRVVDNAAERVANRITERRSSRLAFGGQAAAGPSADAFNRFVPYLQRQVAVCAQLRGYMQVSPNSLIGFRDVMQALEGHLLDDASSAREGILEALEYVLPDGRCPRQYLPATDGKPAIGDLREFVDQGSWAVSAVASYVHATGDAGFLSELVGYHQADEAGGRTLLPAGEHDSVLAHLVRIVEYLIRQLDKDTGLVRALYGDWNDAIDGLGVAIDRKTEFGSGVSVMASLHLHKNLEELIDLLGRVNGSDRQTLADRLQEDLVRLGTNLRRHAVVSRGNERRILHGWGDQRSFYVGGFQDADGAARDGLTSNAFWALSSLYDEDPSIKSEILAALGRLDSTYGYKTFEPGFGPEASAVGRINKLPIGSAENGAAYIHATTFAIAGLFRIGEPRMAWEQIIKILPFLQHHTQLSHSPFVMPNSYVENLELNLDGQSMNDWQSGSSNVLWKTLVRYAAGYQPTLDGLRVSPAAWAPYPEISYEVEAYGAKVRLVRKEGEADQRRIEVNGELWRKVEKQAAASNDAAMIPWRTLRDRDANTIIVTDPVG